MILALVCLNTCWFFSTFSSTAVQPPGITFYHKTIQNKINFKIFFRFLNKSHIVVDYYDLNFNPVSFRVELIVDQWELCILYQVFFLLRYQKIFQIKQMFLKGKSFNNIYVYSLVIKSGIRVSPSVLDSLQSTFLPRTTVMVHCYNLLTWLAQVPASRPLGSVEELTLRQLAVLRLQDKSSSIVYKDDKVKHIR